MNKNFVKIYFKDLQFLKEYTRYVKFMGKMLQQVIYYLLLIFKQQHLNKFSFLY